MPRTLITKAEWDALPPFSQGYVLYMQEEWPHSELKGLTNPYEPSSMESKKFDEGNFKAMLDAQDEEE